MAPFEYYQYRNKYSYPIVCLFGSVNKLIDTRFRTSDELDRYHSILFHSLFKERMVVAYLSVIYWGHVSGKNGGLNRERARSKVDRAIGKINNVDAVARVIMTARKLINARRYSLAIRTLVNLPELGIAFASKVCAFLSEGNCGVIDSVIAHEFQDLEFDVDPKGYVKNNKLNAIRYQEYCRFLQSKATDMNRLGSRLMWRDRDGSTHKWRAVDIERAMYGKASFANLRMGGKFPLCGN